MISTKSSRSSDQLRGNIQAWLASWDFIDNPFERWDAGQEKSLAKYFIRPPFYDQILGSPYSSIVFAPRGSGKSAMRIMIQSECHPTLISSHTFAVSFTDFSVFVEILKSSRDISSDDYVLPIIEKCMVALLKAGANVHATQKIPNAELGELRFWIDRFASDLLLESTLISILHRIAPNISASAMRDLLEARNTKKIDENEQIRSLKQFINLWKSITKIQPKPLPISNFSPRKIMSSFVEFCLRLLSNGPYLCDAMFLLVDGIDEYDVTQANALSSAKILSPLLGNLFFHETPNFAVKFFLPSEQQNELRKATRTDRLEIYELSWGSDVSSGDKLLDILRRRIAFYNTANRQSLAEMCVPAIKSWIETELLKEAKGSPRNLIRLGNQLFIEHCREIPELESLITEHDWERAILWYRTNIFPEQTSVKISHQPQLNQKHLLKVDTEAGRVFVGNKEILPQFPELEFKLLTYLYFRKGKICPYDEIIRFVWGEGSNVNAVMLRSLVYRVRKKLGQPSQRFVRSSSRGYYLDNAI